MDEKDENNPLNGHNLVTIYDAKDFDFKYYHPVKGSKGSLNLTVDQLYNSIKQDLGDYDQLTNNCINTSEMVLTHAENNNGINIIKGMKLDKNEVYDKMAKYYHEHYIRWNIVKSELDDETKKELEKRMKKLK